MFSKLWQKINIDFDYQIILNEELKFHDIPDVLDRAESVRPEALPSLQLVLNTVEEVNRGCLCVVGHVCVR